MPPEGPRCRPGEQCIPLSTCPAFQNHSGQLTPAIVNSIRQALCEKFGDSYKVRDRIHKRHIFCFQKILVKDEFESLCSLAFFLAENPHNFISSLTSLFQCIVLAFQVCCQGSFGNPVPMSPPTNPTLTTPSLPPLHPDSGEALLPPKCETGRIKRDIQPLDNFNFSTGEAVFAQPVKLQEGFSWMAVLGYICK